MKKTTLLSIVMLLPVVVCAQPTQYVYMPPQTLNSNIPLQASYEYEPFFYNPGQFAPLDLGPFSGVEPGFRSSNPLNQLAQNPAWLPDLKGHNLYAYANVQSRNMYKANPNPQYYDPCPYCFYISSASAFIPAYAYNPYYKADGHRLDQQPFLSAALIGYPFKNKRIFAGITYQAIISKEGYYVYSSNSYPQGLDFSSAGATNPVESFQKSTLKQTGHFLSLYGGYKLSDRAVFGLRISSTLYQMNGGYGNHNKNPIIYPGPYYTQSTGSSVTPSDLFTEQRSQHYRDLHVDLGGRYVINRNLTGMAHFGYLIGSGNENQYTSSPLYSETGTPNSGNNYSLTKSLSTAQFQWNNRGHAFNGGLALRYDLSGAGKMRFLYEVYTGSTGLTPDAQYQSSSLTDYQYANNSESVTNTQSTTLRSGEGSGNTWSHQFGLFYTWSPVKLLTVNMGLQYGHYSQNISTFGRKNETGLSLVQQTDTSGQTTTSRQPINSQGYVNWYYHLHEHSFQIPFIAQVRLFGRFQVWGGFNEQIEGLKQRNATYNYNPVYGANLAPAGPSYTNNFHITRYRFTLLSGINFDVNNRVTLHFTALPLDHRYSFNRLYQTSGLIWQAGISFYP